MARYVSTNIIPLVGRVALADVIFYKTVIEIVRGQIGVGVWQEENMFEAEALIDPVWETTAVTVDKLAGNPHALDIWFTVPQNLGDWDLREAGIFAKVRGNELLFMLQAFPLETKCYDLEMEFHFSLVF